MDTVFLTILSGVSVYVIGQIVLKFVVDPLHAQRETIGRVIDFLIQHETRYTHPGTEPNNPMIRKTGRSAEEWRHQLEETKYRARQLASELIFRTHAVPLYTAFQLLPGIRTRTEIRTAHNDLMTLSSSLLNKPVYEGVKNRQRVDRIRTALRVEPEFQVSEALKKGSEDAE